MYYSQPITNKLSLLLLFLFSFCFFCFSDVNKKLEILKESGHSFTVNIDPNDRTEKVVRSIDSTLQQKVVSDQTFSDMIVSISEIFREQGKLTLIIELFLNASSYFEHIAALTKEQTEMLVHMYISLGASHEELGMWNRAMDFYLKALVLSEEYALEPSIAKIYNNIGAVHYSRTELDNAEEYIRKSTEINKKLADKKELFINYNNMAGIYVQRGDYNSALDYALQAIQQLDSEDDSYLYYFMQANIASLYIYKKDYKLALSYLNNAKEHQLLNNFASDLVYTYSLLSKAYEQIGRADSAEYYIGRAMQQAKTLNNQHIESRTLGNMADYYERKGDYPKAYRSLKHSFELKDSILRIDNQKKMNELERVYDAEKKIRENALIIENITVQKLASDRLWIIMAIVALFLIVVILFLINRSHNNEEIRKTNELLANQQLELYEKEKLLQYSKEEELTHTIDKKNRELTFYTLNIVKSNEFISDLKEELKQLLLELNPKDKERKEHVRDILNKLQQQNVSNNWDEFRYYFEQVHPSFYENLEKVYTDLTPKEKKLCAYLRLGLSSKEIAAIAFVEVRSVESARNRLRRKLGMSQDGNLTEFLQQHNFTNETL